MHICSQNVRRAEKVANCFTYSLFTPSPLNKDRAEHRGFRKSKIVSFPQVLYTILVHLAAI